MNSIKEILNDLGYIINSESTTHYSCSANYRGGDNKTALAIEKTTGKWFDFVIGKGSTIENLIQKTLNLETEEEVDIWLKNKKYNISPEESRPIIKLPKIFKKEDFFALPHNYYLDKGIGPQTLKIFAHGICHAGQMRNRYVFMIPDESGNIVGLAGRLIIEDENNSIGKWKLLGRKSSWLYPYYFNKQYIQESKTVILTESIGDMLALWESGIKNCLVMFGIELSKTLLVKLIEINPEKIIIATNNDIEKNSVGNEAAAAIYLKLANFFDKRKLYNGVLEKEKDLMNLFQKNGKRSIIDWLESITGLD